MKMTKFNLEKLKIAKGINKKFKVKCHKLGPETSNLTKHQTLHSTCESALSDKKGVQDRAITDLGTWAMVEIMWTPLNDHMQSNHCITQK